jgi:hypothetical protein
MNPIEEFLASFAPLREFLSAAHFSRIISTPLRWFHAKAQSSQSEQ